MKIEKINENQIRCTLNPQDLQERHLKLSEFAYGSGKAKELFNDMMEKASEEYDFEVDNSPLMIEAIPTSAESLILIITKVDNPDELDTRFSTFTPYEKHEEEAEDEDDKLINSVNLPTSAPELGPLGATVLETIKKGLEELASKVHSKSESEAAGVILAEAKAFRFRTFDNLVAFAKSVVSFFDGTVLLYRVPKDREYLLCIVLGDSSPKDFNRACNIACEYAEMLPKTNLLFYKEHYPCLMEQDVIARLAEF